MTSTTGSSGQEVLQNCTGEFRVYHGTRRDPCTPDLTSQTYLPVVGRKNKPQSAGPYVADVNSSSFKKKKNRTCCTPSTKETPPTTSTTQKLHDCYSQHPRPELDENCAPGQARHVTGTSTKVYLGRYMHHRNPQYGRPVWNKSIPDGLCSGHIVYSGTNSWYCPGSCSKTGMGKIGRKVRVLHDPILGIPFQICGGLSWIYAIYAPTGVTAAQYDEFLRIIENNIITKHEDLSEAFYLVGDWNAHIGRDSKNDKITIGPHTMRQCTSAKGKTLQNGYDRNSSQKRTLTSMSREEERGTTTSQNSGMSWMEW